MPACRTEVLLQYANLADLFHIFSLGLCILSLIGFLFWGFVKVIRDVLLLRASLKAKCNARVPKLPRRILFCYFTQKRRSLQKMIILTEPEVVVRE